VHQQAAQHMYSDLETAFPQIAQWLHDQQFPQAIAGVERFIESRYIERYQANSDLAYGLMRVYQQTGASQKEWTSEQLSAVSEIMQQLVESNQKHLPLLMP
jgi:beta-N-acetylglucosaminidase